MSPLIDVNLIPESLKQLPVTQYDLRIIQLQNEALHQKVMELLDERTNNNMCPKHETRIVRLEEVTEKLVVVTDRHQRYVWMVAGALVVVSTLVNLMKEYLW